MTAPRPYLVWPPPGLETSHGKLWPLIAMLAIGDVVLLLPFLATLGTHQHFASMGPFGQQWWILLLTTAVGVVILTAVAERLTRLAWRAGRAARDGHGWRTILYVVSDESRDTGFLLQGARQFAHLAPSERRLVLSLRLAGALLALAAVLGAPVGLVLGALLGRLRWIEAAGLWTLAFWLPLIAIILGLGARVAAFLLVRTHRGGRREAADEAQALKSEIAQWTRQSHELAGEQGPALGAPGRRGAFSGVSIGLAVVAAMSVLAFTGLAVGGAIGPILASVALPKFSATQGRVLEAEVYRSWALERDSALSPWAAGEALHALFAVGARETQSLMREPARRYDDPFLPGDTLLDGTRFTSRWLLDAFGNAGRTLSPSDRRALRAMGDHPALAEVALLAVAPALDIAGTRYRLPLPDSVTPAALPIPRYLPLRESARARLAGALLDLAEGRTQSAERGVREVISMGLVIMDEGVTLIDALIGTMIVREGGEALDGLLRATGRGRQADEIARLRAHTQQVAERMGVVALGGSAEETMESIPRLVTDSAAVRGLRWELYLHVRSLAPCANLHRMVFGPGEEYREWIERARASLVRRESEAQMFDFLGRGFFGTDGCLPVFRELRAVNAVQ